MRLVRRWYLPNQLLIKFDRMLRHAKNNVDISTKQILKMDSLDMADEHRQILLKACQNTEEDKIIIAHGTDTMPETAKLLGENISNKTVILTGAMIPYSFGYSVTRFSISAALSLRRNC